MPNYATSSDYLTYTGASAAPANITALLRSASMLVHRDTLSAIYPVDATGNPTDPATIAAMRDATCAQAAAWVLLGVDPLAGGVVTTKIATSKSLDGGAITYAGAQQAADARATAIQSLVQDAQLILDAAGLLNTSVWTDG